MSKQTQYPNYPILGVEIDAVTVMQANELICNHAADPASEARYVVKPYSEFLDAASRQPELKTLLNNAWLSLPDGIAVCWAATYLYGGARTWRRVVTTGASIVLRPSSMYGVLPEKFAGANATWSLLGAAAERNLKVFLIGSPYGTTIAHTAAAIITKLPGLNIVGTAPGEINGLHGADLLHAVQNDLNLTPLAAQINATNPDIILIGMGFPLQETIMQRLKPLLHHGVMIGEGGTFDYDSFGGQQTRAPEVIQKIGLEWLWRLILNPSRLKRQLAIPRLIWRVAHEPRL